MAQTNRNTPVKRAKLAVAGTSTGKGRNKTTAAKVRVGGRVVNNPPSKRPKARPQKAQSSPARGRTVPSTPTSKPRTPKPRTSRSSAMSRPNSSAMGARGGRGDAGGMLQFGQRILKDRAQAMRTGPSTRSGPRRATARKPKSALFGRMRATIQKAQSNPRNR